MSNSKKILRFVKPAAALALLAAAGCTEVNDPYSARYPGYYGGNRYSYYDPYHRRYPSGDYYQNRWYEHELDEQRQRNARERWRIQKERERLALQQRAPAYRSPPAEERCPPGFHPSTKRCTDAERRRGCKDIGLSNGRGCRNFPG